ncbi:LysR family transcriptional regulator [Rubellicoccus peritrichatus]|uniref:LysR substrate-binding domain-containing protein n=1 Tax=Rubellicoccus peritrichatus TaxID=3080537 RepID=A0AAQ3QXC5_9BACT|nr:LysR substrate-binding domain-containing protein [Puniceicoccus sp. CR14]WOO42902.1 LysR substrate-binding domain-containing protein [Puniceicoccus sp. CR14]
MEMHQLRYFVAVARLGNFTRAAEHCNVAQPSLSQQIRKLETSLDETLVHRLPGGKSVLTPAGELLYKRACRILSEVKAAEEELVDRRGVVSGQVRVGAIPTIAPFLLADAIYAFGQDYPDVTLVVQEMTTERLLEMLDRSELDFAVLSPPLDGGPWNTRELGVEPLYLAANRDNALLGKEAVSLGDIRDEDFILMSEGHCLTDQVERFCNRADFRPRVRFMSAQVETLKSLIRAGVGVSLLPAMAMDLNPHPEDMLRYASFTDPQPKRSVVFAWRPEFTLSQASVVFQDYLKKAFVARAERGKALIKHAIS